MMFIPCMANDLAKQMQQHRYAGADVDADTDTGAKTNTITTMRTAIPPPTTAPYVCLRLST